MTTDTKAVVRWEVQEVPKGIEHIRCAKYPDLLDYHHGVSGKGPHAYTWEDKPHRLVYDLTAGVAELRDEITDHERVVGELRAEIESLRKDAERYRWIRESVVRDGNNGVQFDSEIDAAMKEQAE